MRGRLEGFALIEIALALIILGLITSFILPLMNGYKVWQAQQKTENHHQQIIASLANYVLRTHRLPCPALNQMENGKAQPHCRSGIGLVPYKTLGLSEKIAKDGQHQWFTYIVNPELTSIAIQSIDQNDAKSFCKCRNRALTMEEVDLPDHDCLAVVLTSSPPPQSLNLKKDLHGRSIWVTRDNLMAIHAKRPCQETASLPPARGIPGPPPPINVFKNRELPPKNN